MSAMVPHDEAARMAALLHCDVLDTSPESAFDDIVGLASQICEAPMALVTLIDAERQWFKAKVGLAISETPRDVSFCAHAILGREPLVVQDALEDARFRTNPLVLSDPNIRFYAGIPLRVDGETSPIGSLCVLDRVPRTLRPGQLEALTALARRVEVELKARRERLRGGGSAGPPNPGTVLADRYVVGERLGAGGMGTVFAGIDRATNERVAIKFLNVTGPTRAEVTARFVLEAQVLLRVRSENVTRILDVGNLDDGSPFIVMEHLRGEDLASRLDRGPMPVTEAIDFAIDACAGLAAVHAAGIVHRDVKPANLFIARASDGKEVIKLLDFGIAKLSSVEELASDAKVTSEFAVVGSIHYMAPEQMMGEPNLDSRADVWSLGVIVYEMLAGHVPYDGNTITEVCARVFTKPPVALEELRSDVPALLATTVSTCLQRDASHRCPSAERLAWMLAPFGSRSRPSAP
jgi:tRNA A-37 threonylcarbamoyl transferase component Bud32